MNPIKKLTHWFHRSCCSHGIHVTLIVVAVVCSYKMVDLLVVVIWEALLLLLLLVPTHIVWIIFRLGTR